MYDKIVCFLKQVEMKSAKISLTHLYLALKSKATTHNTYHSFYFQTQCGNYKNLLLYHFENNFVKATFFLHMSQKS